MRARILIGARLIAALAYLSFCWPDGLNRAYAADKTTLPEFLAAITDVTQERSPMTGEIARLVIESFRQPTPPTPESVGLTQREEECLRLLARGSANKEIAQRMGVSPSTVHFHLKSIYQKLHVRSRTEATLRYLRSSPGAAAQL